MIPCILQLPPLLHKESLKENNFTLQISQERSSLPLNEEALIKFQQLKEAFTKDLALSDFNPALPTILVTDSSDYALGSVLSKVSDSGKHPVAFDICNLLPEELNYEINDKEITSIVGALKHWRSFLLYLFSSF
ncbi:hypothetical protein O181_062955 [Austropuccinia psidii MF-1]|uniref:Reverse transcriptase/retrotransposon-derived protein RNase H-like domain-containing protein n=1 Tax=Austropuccinia psidii MF-1 TaxID=1389203 RepID=A0A9Q3I1S9_9BASI|nr:hypothetical protein [Austropuccinia psidii MF-1]